MGKFILRFDSRFARRPSKTGVCILMRCEQLKLETDLHLITSLIAAWLLQMRTNTAMPVASQR